MTGLLLITHTGLASSFLTTVHNLLGELTRPTETIEIARGDDPERRVADAEAAAVRLDDGSGVLVITDALGGTPSNVATTLAGAGAGRLRRVVAGLNLPMLIRVYNYPQLGLDELAASAIEAGRTGVLDGSPPDHDKR